MRTHRMQRPTEQVHPTHHTAARRLLSLLMVFDVPLVFETRPSYHPKARRAHHRERAALTRPPGASKRIVAALLILHEAMVSLRGCLVRLIRTIHQMTIILAQRLKRCQSQHNQARRPQTLRSMVVLQIDDSGHPSPQAGFSTEMEQHLKLHQQATTEQRILTANSRTCNSTRKAKTCTATLLFSLIRPLLLLIAQIGSQNSLALAEQRVVSRAKPVSLLGQFQALSRPRRDSRGRPLLLKPTDRLLQL